VLASEGLQRIRDRARMEAPRRKMKRSRTTRVIVWLMVIYVAFLVGSQEWRLYQLRQEAHRTNQLVLIYDARNQLLRSQIDYLMSDEYVEKAAREQLGYINGNEIPYITKTKTNN